MSSKVKAVIFDWDETLSQNRDVVVGSMNYVLKTYGMADWDVVKKEKRDANKSLKENFPNFFDDKANEAYDLYLDTYKANLAKGLKPVAGAPEFVNHLKEQGIPLFVVSNKDKSLLDDEVACLFPNSPFQAILGNGAAEHNKPHPAPVYKALEGLGLNPAKDEIWLVGDSKQDTDCAIASGCVPILVGAGKFMSADYLVNDSHAKKIVNFTDFDALLQRVKSSLSFADIASDTSKASVKKLGM